MSTSSVPSFKVSHGPDIPVVAYGLGTARATDRKSQDGGADQSAIDYTKTAIKVGLYHLDGAEYYGNESELGTAMQESGLPRSTFYLTTKLFPNISNPREALKTSLHKLRTDYLDLWLIHAPYFDEKEKGITLEQVWLEFEKAHKEGLVKTIGVSNFRIEHLERIFKVATIKPAVNQIEFNPYLQSTELREFHAKHDIVTTAYSPLAPITHASGGPLDVVVEKLCKKYNRTNTQILLRWTIDMGVVAITTSAKESRMKEAIEATEFKLDKEDIDEITKAGSQGHHRTWWKEQYAKVDQGKL